MNRFSLVTVSVGAMLFAAACGSESNANETSNAVVTTPRASMPTTPQATVVRLLELARAGDWETYVDDFYGEAHKFRSDSDRDMLVDRLRNKWGSKVVESLQKVKGIEPTLSDDGKQAVFEIDGGNSFTLYKDEQGNWKFHL